MGGLLAHSNQHERAIAEHKRALELDRNEVFGHGGIGVAKAYGGHAEDTEGHVEEALRLSPRDTLRPIWLYSVGAAKVYLGLDDEAVRWCQRAIDANRTFMLSHFYLAAALAHLGRLAEAREAVQTGLAINPKFTLRFFRHNAPGDSPVFRAQYERALTGMRLAGVPEG